MSRLDKIRDATVSHGENRVSFTKRFGTKEREMRTKVLKMEQSYAVRDAVAAITKDSGLTC